MPFYELKGMINTLYLLTHPLIDFATENKRRRLEVTEKNQHLPSFNTPSLCLQAKGEAAELSTCDNGPLQHWVYDRPSGTITNPDLGKCLEISYRAPAFGLDFPVAIADCFGDEWQKWTYDPETGALLSAMGTVLTISPDWLTRLRWWNIADDLNTLLTRLGSEDWFRPGDPIWSAPLALIGEHPRHSISNTAMAG